MGLVVLLVSSSTNNSETESSPNESTSESNTSNTQSVGMISYDVSRRMKSRRRKLKPQVRKWTANANLKHRGNVILFRRRTTHQLLWNKYLTNSSSDDIAMQLFVYTC